MQTLLLLVLAVVMPTALGYSFVAARRLNAMHQARRPAWPATRPLERIRDDLCRLHRQLEEIENAPPELPAKNHRCRATRAAYVDALTAACSQLDVAPPSGRPVPDAELYRVEAALRRCGMDVRPVVS